MKKISKIDEYLFDLNGYIIIKNALNKKELEDLNKILDKLKNLKNNEWDGYVHGHNYGGKEGLNLFTLKLSRVFCWVSEYFDFDEATDDF